MNLYLETSAVLSWLLGEDDAGKVEDLIRRADQLLTSELTRAECLRAYGRMGATNAHRDALQRFQVRWTQVPVGSGLLIRCGESFPVEPVRTLDAIHLLTAILLRPSFPGLVMLSLDHRVRQNAAALGFSVLPSDIR